MKDIAEVNARMRAFTVSWMPIRRCNYDCSYCYPGAHDTFSDVPKVEDLIPQARRLISEIRAKTGNYNVIFSLAGGEVFLIKDVHLLFKAIHDMGCRSHVVTNLSAPAGIYLKSAPYLMHIVASWHFESNRDKHMMRTLKTLNESGVTINAAIMNHPKYQERVFVAEKFCKENNIQHRVNKIDGLEVIPVKVVYE